ncbi:hypothetical protein K474DRAFT_1095085 [Panus rudis PR-1116 ss-1]|nr:hypothetical protein K474DRAFT_1095085 [Panus rudis PR-1116 ss-1]
MMKGDNFEVQITCDDAPLTEYPTPSSIPRVHSCYIQSEAGKRFKVDVSNHAQQCDVEARIFIDGRLLARTVVKSSEHNWADGAQVSTNIVRPFIFSDVEVTDDEARASPDQQNLDLGTIEVHIFRVIVQQEQQWEGQMVYEEIGPIHERCKKIGIHQVSLGEAEQAPSVHHATVQMIDSISSPFQTFVFYYRPRERLQAEGIVLVSDIPTTIEPYRLQQPIPPLQQRPSRSLLHVVSTGQHQTSQTLGKRPSQEDLPDPKRARVASPAMPELDDSAMVYGRPAQPAITPSLRIPLPATQHPNRSDSNELAMLENQLALMTQQTKAVEARIIELRAQKAAESSSTVAMPPPAYSETSYVKRESYYHHSAPPQPRWSDHIHHPHQHQQYST